MVKLLFTALLVLFGHVAFSQEENSDFFNDGVKPNTIDQALKISISDMMFGKFGLKYEIDFKTRINVEIEGGMLTQRFQNPSSLWFFTPEFDQLTINGGYYVGVAPIFDVCDCDLGEYWGIGPKYTYYGLNQTPESDYDGLSSLSAILHYEQIWNKGNIFWEAEFGLGLAFFSPANSLVQAKTVFIIPFNAGLGFLF